MHRQRVSQVKVLSISSAAVSSRTQAARTRKRTQLPPRLRRQTCGARKACAPAVDLPDYNADVIRVERQRHPSTGPKRRTASL